MPLSGKRCFLLNGQICGDPFTQSIEWVRDKRIILGLLSTWISPSDTPKECNYYYYVTLRPKFSLLQTSWQTNKREGLTLEMGQQPKPVACAQHVFPSGQIERSGHVCLAPSRWTELYCRLPACSTGRLTATRVRVKDRLACDVIAEVTRRELGR